MSTTLEREALEVAANYLANTHKEYPTITELAEVRGALVALSRVAFRMNSIEGAGPALEDAEKVINEMIRRGVPEGSPQRLADLSDKLMRESRRWKA